MTVADTIRLHVREKYVIPAQRRKEKQISIRAGDVVRDLGLVGRTPAVCSALTGKKFRESNNLRLLKVNGPKSGQSTTVVCTYELVETKSPPTGRDDPWQQLRGALKNIFSELGGGEGYLRNERDNFYSSRDHK
ncbi:MAG: hypothetical protein ACHP8A_17290 [Terriglobales bacterium]|nr:hypothetical protein [Terriglobales bacterium]